MVWTTPRTWIDQEIVKTTHFQNQISDNLSLTLPALGEANAGDMGYANAANSQALVSGDKASGSVLRTVGGAPRWTTLSESLATAYYSPGSRTEIQASAEDSWEVADSTNLKISNVNVPAAATHLLLEAWLVIDKENPITPDEEFYIGWDRTTSADPPEVAPRTTSGSARSRFSLTGSGGGTGGSGGWTLPVFLLTDQFTADTDEDWHLYIYQGDPATSGTNLATYIVTGGNLPPIRLAARYVA